MTKTRDPELEKLRFPIGRFYPDHKTTADKRKEWIAEIAEAPLRLKKAVEGKSAQELDRLYRPGGWTVRQVVHHLADSHLNGYVRFKMALTEDVPQMQLYNQKKWADLEDARTAPVDLSINLLESLHRRWVLLLESLQPEDYKRLSQHAQWGDVSLDMQLQIYAWHGRHHVAHVESAG